MTTLLHWHLHMNQLVELYGAWFVGGAIFLESMGLPVPGETALISASLLASQGALNYYTLGLVAFIAAVLGDNLGYAVGRFAGRPFVQRHGTRVGITPDKLDRAEAFLQRYGLLIIAAARFFPLLRQLAGVSAGTIRMPWWEFLVGNAVGAGLWVGLWLLLGKSLGAALHSLLLKLHLGTAGVLLIPAMFVFVTLLVLLGYWLRRHLRQKR